MYQGTPLKEARTVRTGHREGGYGVPTGSSRFLPIGKDRTKIKGGVSPPELEFEFLTCLTSAVAGGDRSIIDIISQTVKPEYIEDRTLRAIFEVLIRYIDLDTIFQELDGQKRRVFLDLLEKSTNAIAIMALPLSREVIDAWRIREIKRLEKLYVQTLDPAEKEQIHREIMLKANLDPSENKNGEHIKDLLLSKALTEEDFDFEFDWLYPDLLLYGTYNIFFAPPSSGKSLFALSLACRLLEEGKIRSVYYVDGDNSLIVLQKRGIKRLLKRYPGLHYFKPNSAGEMREILEMISQIREENALVIIDSLKDVAGADYSLDKSREAKQIDDLIKRVRDSNGCPKTVIVLHHVTKSSDLPTVFRAKNSTVFQDSADQTYFFRKINQENDAIYVELQEGKHRLSHKNFRFKVYFEHRFEEVDFVLPREEQDIITAARKVISERKKITFDLLVKTLQREYGLPYKKAYQTLREHGERFFSIKREKFPNRIVLTLKGVQEERTQKSLRSCGAIENKGIQISSSSAREEHSQIKEKTQVCENEELVRKNRANVNEAKTLRSCGVARNQGIQPIKPFKASTLSAMIGRLLLKEREDQEKDSEKEKNCGVVENQGIRLI